MNFLVTGGAGFIGSHVTEQLIAEGHNVTVVDNLATGNIDNLPQHSQLKWLSKDILNCSTQDFSDTFDGIAHLAATPSVTESWLNPLAAHHNNLSATIAVIELCKTLKIPRLVLTSSAAVYGNPIQVPIAENHPTTPISPYGLQKLGSEQYANLFAQHDGFSIVSLRLFNVFGPRQVPNSPYSGVISIFTEAMRRGLPITLHGDGTQTRDFIYVKDVANAFLKALTVPLSAGSCLTCNIGTGKAISLLQLLEILRETFSKWHSDINFSDSRLGDIHHSEADIFNAYHYLAFKPQWTIESGLTHFAAHSNRAHLFI